MTLFGSFLKKSHPPLSEFRCHGWTKILWKLAPITKIEMKKHKLVVIYLFIGQFYWMWSAKKEIVFCLWVVFAWNLLSFYISTFKHLTEHMLHDVNWNFILFLLYKCMRFLSLNFRGEAFNHVHNSNLNVPTNFRVKNSFRYPKASLSKNLTQTIFFPPLLFHHRHSRL